MKLKKIIGLVLITLVAITQTQTVSADLGPKASITVHIEGVENTDYAFEILYHIPASRSVDRAYYIDNFLEIMESSDYAYYQETYPEAFLYYEDFDRYFPFSVYAPFGPGWMRQTDEHTYYMGYNAPSEMKFMIYTEHDTLIVSDEITRNKFEAEYTWDLTDVDLTEDSMDANDLTLSRDLGSSIFQFFLRVVLTLAIELGILWLFTYRLKRSFKLVALVNIFTQSLLSLFVVLMYYYSGWLGATLVLFLGEAIVFTLEALIYAFKLKEKNTALAVVYAVVANAVSLLFSLLIW